MKQLRNIHTGEVIQDVLSDEEKVNRLFSYTIYTVRLSGIMQTVSSLQGWVVA